MTPKATFVGTEMYPRNEGTVSLLFESDQSLFLVDAPPDITKVLDDLSINPSAIDELFITHGHIDHLIGVPYLVTGRFFEKVGSIKEGPSTVGELTVRSNEATLDSFETVLSGLSIDLDQLFDEDEYALNIVQTGDEFRVPPFDVRVIEAEHTLPTNGLVISANRTVAYTCDTADPVQLTDSVGSCDVLVCNAVYHEEDRELADQLKHATGKEAGTLARHVDAEELYLLHISDTYEEPDHVREQASEQFDGDVIVPDALDTFEL